ncbi:mechanosensitive ion channel family protein [Haliangium sp.]|uniref:mechanosensitive ion channel family protein n=1 Tax=Haliangium sp. TaxID=2663208 RepID=UPI003D1523B1
MSEIQDWIQELWAIELVRDGLRATTVLLIGFFVTRVVSRRLLTWSVQAQHRILVRRAVTALLLVLTVAWAMSELGLKLGVVLGAAGVLTVAVGFAAQTSVSNLISGLFLMAERPFRVGDVITVADTTGEVLSIDLLSVKLCTFDNLMVRIPNETMLKANVTNLTQFPIRRYDLFVGVAYKEDLKQVRELLLKVADQNPLALRNPTPSVLFMGFGDSSIDLRLSTWATRENLIAMRNSLSFEVKRAFDEQGIEIPFPQRTLQVGQSAAPYLAAAAGIEPSAPESPPPAG